GAIPAPNTCGPPSPATRSATTVANSRPCSAGTGPTAVPATRPRSRNAASVTSACTTCGATTPTVPSRRCRPASAQASTAPAADQLPATDPGCATARPGTVETSTSTTSVP